ncbi:alpha/beta hydrolase [Sphaerisporangium aureirubrum]|uniref:Alpha/beta hydrolase n=1 Tax=Sphaerisporangium aureirubrum TaxID=1544736 RepID=A0ABW1NK33_9ACTN
MRATFRLALAVVMALTLTAPAEAGVHPAITWTPCAGNQAVECATVRVPVDWSRPGGASVELALARRAAADPGARIGSLLFDPGGPGGSAAGLVLSDDRFTYFSERLRRHFDIIGVDRRGVGRSHPVLCSGALVDQEPYPVPSTQAEFDRIAEHNRRVRADCRARTGPLFDHVDTRSAAYDLDAVRAALGEPSLSFMGISYGTVLAGQYAEEFPHRVRAVVLDSVLDHSLGTRGLLDAGAASGQDSFDEFAAWCARDTRCALHSEDVRALWARLLARAGRGELVLGSGPPYRLRPAELLRALGDALRGPVWAESAEVLRALDSGAPFPAPDLPPPSPEVVPYPVRIRCADFHMPVRDHREFARHLRRTALIAPDMRYSADRVEEVARCLGTPAPIPNPQHRLRVRPGPPLLVINTRHDPVTGYSMARNVAAQLGPRARLVTYDGWGHGATPRTPCTTAIVDDYLISLILPAPGTRCPGVPPDETASRLAEGPFAPRGLTWGSASSR